jgi:hypothetical protein
MRMRQFELNENVLNYKKSNGVWKKNGLKIDYFSDCVCYIASISAPESKCAYAKVVRQFFFFNSYR